MTKLAMPFPNPSTYEGHSGVDFGQPFGKPILSSGHGFVTYTGWLNDNAGYSTILTYDGGLPVLYCHQPGTASLPARGEVWYGSGIGLVGSSGHSTGPHLHAEIMAGSGAHTYAGFWNYFTADAYVGDGSGAGGGSVPFDPKGFLMALSDAQQAQIYDALVVNGGQYYMPEAIINELRGQVEPKLDGIVARTDASNTWLSADRRLTDADVAAVAEAVAAILK